VDATDWQRICREWVSGRTVWAVRHIPTGEYGAPYDWSMVVIRRHWFDRYPIVTLVQGMTLAKRREIGEAVLARFRGATAVEHGQKFVWNRAGGRIRA